MSRPRKDNSMEAVERRKFAGERIKQYRIDFGSQEQFAELLDVDVSTLRRYESGKWDIPKKISYALSIHSGIIEQYWRGITHAKTNEEWIAETKLCSLESAALHTLAELEEERKAEIERHKTLFYMCGYRYECIEGTAEYDFGSTDKPHILTRYAEPDAHYYFSNEELRQLIEKINSTIGFACYEMSRK